MKFNNQKLRNYDPVVGEELLEDRTRLWICVLLSQARGPIPPNDLLDMLPLEVREDRAYAMSAIRHLYRSLETLEIGHETLKEFLLKRHGAYMEQGNDLLLQFCRQYPDHRYSVANTLYHDAQSAYPLNAVLDCTQDWADKAARVHVKPEWVMEDVKRAAELAVEMQLPAESLRLALLLKRLNVRYRTAFTEFREEIAASLIAQKQFREVLQYITHDDGLKICADRAFVYLGQFYAYEAWTEAVQLRTCIDKQYRSELDNSLRSALYYAAMKAKTPWSAPVFAPDPCNYPDMEWSREDTIRLIWDHCAAWNNPVLLTYNELLSTGEQLEDLLDCEEDPDRIVAYAESALEFDRLFGEVLKSRLPVRRLLRRMIANLEAMLRIHGLPETATETKAIIKLFLANQPAAEVLTVLMTKYLGADSPVSLWASNRVDPDLQAFEQMRLAATCRGYLSNEGIPEISAKKWFQKTWETDLQNLIEELYFLHGMVLRHKASGTTVPARLQHRLQLLIKSMKFSLESRSQWQRSYLLPEQVFPELYQTLVALTSDAFPRELEYLLKSMLAGSRGQLGLYSEGFRKVIRVPAETLADSEFSSKYVLKLAETWQEHVISGVMNRWERCEELLHLAVCYGTYNEKTKAAVCWQQMLESSMGPFWRDESQFCLINDALIHFGSAPGHTLQKFASLLDYASGEMSYPNAVKSIKEEFAGVLTATGEAEKALSYYRFEVLPAPETVLMNAEKSTFDAPTRGAGYHLGAANLRESEALPEILIHLNCNPVLKLGLCSLFAPSDTSAKSAKRYGKRMAQIMNEAEVRSKVHADLFAADWTQLITRQLSLKTRRLIAGVLAMELTPSNCIRFDRLLNELDPVCAESVTEAECGNLYEMNSLNGTGNGIAQAGEKLSSSWIKHVLHPSENYGFSTKKLGTALAQLLDVEASTLPAGDLLDIISRHFAYLVCPDKSSVNKYRWLNDANAGSTANQLAVQLLIWHLNHPDNSVSIRAEETLVKLAPQLPEVANELLLQCTGDQPEYASELCSAVLYQVCRRNPSAIGSQLQPSAIAAAALIQHVSIRKNLLDAGTELEKAGYPELYAAVSQGLRDDVAANSLPYVPNLALASLQDVLDDLQSGQFLDQEFSDKIRSLMAEYCFPLTQNMVKMSDWYVRRSFNREQWMTGSYEHFVKHALNNAVAHRITKKNIESVYEIIND